MNSLENASEISRQENTTKKQKEKKRFYVRFKQKAAKQITMQSGQEKRF